MSLSSLPLHLLLSSSTPICMSPVATNPKPQVQSLPTLTHLGLSFLFSTFVLVFRHGFRSEFRARFVFRAWVSASLCVSGVVSIYGFRPLSLCFWSGLWICSFFFLVFCFLFCSSSLVFDGYWLQWQVCGYVVISMVLIVVVAVFWRVNEILFIVVFILFYYSVYIILLC